MINRFGVGHVALMSEKIICSSIVPGGGGGGGGGVVVDVVVVVPPAGPAREAAMTQAWLTYVKGVAAACTDYFRENVMQHPSLPVFEATAMANPHFILRNAPLSAADVRSKVAPLLDKLVTPALVQNMVSELARYQLACRATADWDVNTVIEKAKLIETFWTKHQNLPAWTEFAHLCMLLDPSSASVERAFSILKYLFTDLQSRSLQDKIEASLMLRFNRGLQRRHQDRAV